MKQPTELKRLERPIHPAGPFIAPAEFDDSVREKLIDQIASLPARLRGTVEPLNRDQLSQVYRNWSVRQIVHHLADSHVNSYVRFKWTLTEETPTIKAYDEGRWAELNESRTGDIGPSLILLDGLHARWCQLLRNMTDLEFQRCFHHPESGQTVSLNDALAYYAWHGRHHTAQIEWLLEKQA